MADLPTFVAKPMPDGRSLLLDLPRELRDNVYDKVLEDSIMIPLWIVSSKLVNGSRLVGANKQIHREFTQRFNTSNADVYTRVWNFNFQHIIAFLGRNRYQFNRKIQIQLFFGSSTGWRGLTGLRNWFGLWHGPGLRIEVSYRVISSSFPLLQRPISWDVLGLVSDEQSQEEMKKIWKALGTMRE